MPRTQRLTLGPDGLLRDRENHVVARLSSLTLEWGVGGDVVHPSTALESSTDVDKTSTQGGAGGVRIEDDRVGRVWSHYQNVIPGAERQRLDGTKRTIIRNALKSEQDRLRELGARASEAVVTARVRCEQAIDGLAASPHHNGQNDRRKKYLGIRYALKGNSQNGEGTDERIQKMCEFAEKGTSVEATVPSAQREMVRERQRHVVEWHKNPGDDRMRATGERAAAWLKETLGLIYVRDVRATGGGFWEREANE